MTIIHKLEMDLTALCPPPQIPAKQGEANARAVELTLLENGAPWTIPPEAVVLIRYRKPDGTGGMYDTLPQGERAWSAEGQRLTVTLARQMLACPGMVRADVVLSTAGEILCCFEMHILVEKDILTAAELESQDYYNFTTLPQLQAALQSLERSTVRSVNGKTGNVTLSAGEVGALPLTGGKLEGNLDLGGNRILNPASDGSSCIVGGTPGWFLAATLEGISQGMDVSLLLSVQHLYDNACGLVALRLRQQTGTSFMGYARVLLGFNLDPADFRVYAADGKAYLYCNVRWQFDFLKLQVLSQEDRAWFDGGHHYWVFTNNRQMETEEPGSTLAFSFI